MKYCTECSEELEDDWEHDMCEACMNNLAGSILHTDDFGIDLEDLE